MMPKRIDRRDFFEIEKWVNVTESRVRLTYVFSQASFRPELPFSGQLNGRLIR